MRSLRHLRHWTILKEEALNMKSSLNKSVLDDLRASDDWFDKWKLNHGIREKHISEESLVSETTVESWMERIKEICTGYDCQNIWNMDGRGCFIKALPSKGMAKKGKKTKGGKKSKQRVTVAFFVSADGGKVGKPIVIWKSKNTQCFRKANAAGKRDQVSYFFNPKSWKQVDIMENIFEQLNREKKMQGKSVTFYG